MCIVGGLIGGIIGSSLGAGGAGAAGLAGQAAGKFAGEFAGNFAREAVDRFGEPDGDLSLSFAQASDGKASSFAAAISRDPDSSTQAEAHSDSTRNNSCETPVQSATDDDAPTVQSEMKITFTFQRQR